ncbi:MAG: hypothetical protein IKA51_00935 [Clostridia bacterium]|nr:hypothetical protein [Clostridia bacterium]
MSKVKEFFNSFLNNNGVLKLISFIIAFIFWFIVVGIESPEIEKEYRNIPVSISLDGTVAEENNLMLTNNINATVTVTLVGERSVIASIDRSSIKASLDLSQVIGAGQYDCNIIIDCDNIEMLSNVKSNIKFLTINLDNKVSKSVDISVITNGSVAEGYILDSVKPYPTSLLVTGPESIVNSVVSAAVSLDVSDISSTAVKNLPFTLYDADGNVISSPLLSFDTNQIMVTANVYKTKEITLNYNIINTSGGNDADFITKIISPQTLLISGAEDVISRISSLDIGTLDACGVADAGFSEDIKLVLPNGVKVVDNTSSVNVSVSYDDVETRELSIAVTSDDIIKPDGRNVTTKTKYITVAIRGRSSDLDKLVLDDISPVIDASQQTVKGNVKIPVTFDLPEDLYIGVKGEYEIAVTIK